MTSSRTALLGLTLAALVTGCSHAGATTKASGPPRPAGDSADASTATSPGAAAGDATTATVPPWDDDRKVGDTSDGSSLVSMIGVGAVGGPGSPEDVQANARAMMQRRAEAIAACMQQQGFEYAPYVPGLPATPPEPPAYDRLTRREFAEQYGFGISTMDDVAAEEPPHADVNPNEAYQASLSPAEAQAFDHAMYGDTYGPDVSVADDAPPQGCVAAGLEELRGGRTDAEQAFLADLAARAQKVYDAVAVDRRVITAEQGYATCMAGAGYPGIDRPETAQRTISDRLAETTGDPEALHRLQLDERAIARADLACSRDLRKTTYEVTRELEARFLADNAADVGRYESIVGRKR